MALSTEERNRVLRLVEAGKLSATEAADLLDALSVERDRLPERARTRMVRVRVSSLQTGRLKVSVAIPVSLMQVGLRLGARLAPQFSGSEPDDLLQAIADGASGRLLDWQDPTEDERVEIVVD